MPLLTASFPRERLYKWGRKQIQTAEAELFVINIDHPHAVLTPHPLLVKLYGDSEPDADLMASIRKVGIQNPIIVTEDRLIISGNRRYKAWSRLHAAQPRKHTGYLVVRVMDYSHPLQEERMVIACNCQRTRTKDQRKAEDAELARILTDPEWPG